MLPKPDACRPCPMWQTGHGYVPDEWREGALVVILGQNPGADEEDGQQVVSGGRDGNTRPHPPAPFLGRTGHYVETQLLPLAGLRREDCSWANVLRCRWQRSNALPPETILGPAIAHCQAAYWRPPASTKLILACGALAHRALGGRGGVHDWAGFVWEL